MKRFLVMLLAIAVMLPFFLPSDAFPQTRRGAGEDSDEEMMKMEEEAEALPLKPVPPIKMVFVKGGCYEMGDHIGDGDDDERPAHEVCIGDFYLAETEVTQELFEAVMGFSPFKIEPKKPMIIMSWYWANRFIKRLNERTKGYYRLPTEAEWEYAAREGGKKILWSGTNDAFNLKDYAWFSENSEGVEIKEVAQKKPNALGLYDMSGNVWEWVDDHFDFDYYKKSPKKNPFGPDTSFWKVIRGGSVTDPAFKLRTTYRHALEPQRRNLITGFRLAR